MIIVFLILWCPLVFGTLKNCDVKDFGAKGDGKTLDTAAINAAIIACDMVTFSEGTFLSGTIHLKSNLIINIAKHATIHGASNNVNAYDIPPDNPYEKYQDYGHSHWRDSLLWGEKLKNITISGEGKINGGGLSSGQPPKGGGCKVFGLRSCSNVTLKNFKMEKTGWFAVLATDCEYLTIQNLEIKPTRDGLDVVGCRHVRITGVSITGGGDDAIALKSDYSVGKVLKSFDIIVSNSTVGCGCNGLQFGSETVGPFSNITWENIHVIESGKAGIGIVSMDGAEISYISYRNITMTGVTTPIYFYIGARSRRPAPLTVGSIHNIILTDITAVDVHGKRGNWTSTFDGQPGDEHAGGVEYFIGGNISFNNIQITYKGGGLAKDSVIDPPHFFDKYPPRYLGVRPSYGYFIRRTKGVTFRGINIKYEKEDLRPGIILEDVDNIVFDDVTTQRSTKSKYDVGIRANCSRVIIKNSPGLIVKNVTAIDSHRTVKKPVREVEIQTTT